MMSMGKFSFQANFPRREGRGKGSSFAVEAGSLVLGGRDLDDCAHVVEAGVVKAHRGGGIGVDGDDAAVHQVVVLHAVHAVGDGGVGEVGGLGAEVGVVHAAGGVSAVADEGVSAGVVGDASLGEVLIDGELGGHDDVVSRGEDGVHTIGDQRGSGSDDFVVRTMTPSTTKNISIPTLSESDSTPTSPSSNM